MFLLTTMQVVLTLRKQLTGTTEHGLLPHACSKIEGGTFFLLSFFPSFLSFFFFHKTSDWPHLRQTAQNETVWSHHVDGR